MIQTIWSGMHGMVSQQNNIDSIANNISNINSFGYKRTRVDFRETLYETMISPTLNGPDINLQRGAGVLVHQNIRDFAQGASLDTGRALDFALEGNGFFSVENSGGEVQYTRNGAFYISMEAGGNYLVDGRGRYLLDQNGGRIAVRGAPDKMSVALDGSLSFTMDDGTPVDSGIRLGIYTFDNRTGLTAVEDGNFVPSENSGPARLTGEAQVIQYSLEASNVDYSYEVARLIRAQRAYQLASRCVTTADQMAGIVNSIRN